MHHTYSLYAKSTEAGRMREVRLSQGTIRYRDDGPPDGPVFVFVHAFLTGGSVFRKVVAELDGWARCLTPDWPLGAHTIAMDDDADVTPRGVAAIVAEFLDALDLRDVTLVGNDTGGAVSQVVATEHGERVGRLVLVACDAFEAFPPKLFVPIVKAAAKGPAAVKALLTPMRAATMRRTPVGFGFTAKHGIPDDVTEAWVRPALTDAAVRRDIAKLCQGIDPAITLDAAAKLARFDKPALIVWAREDKFFPNELGERLAATIPGSRLEWVDDAYAFVSEDQPGKLAALLTAFARDAVPA
jgi:pimeloyl-ACP methyl ester carboxylesterase